MGTKIRHVTVMIGKVESVPLTRFAKRICPACKTERFITQRSKFLKHNNGEKECRAVGLTIDQYNKLNEELIAARKATFK